MKQWSQIIKQLTLLTQFGLSLITPLLLCLFISYVIMTRTGAAWVFIPGFFFGIGGSATFAWKFYGTIVNKENKKKKQRRGRSFNRH